MSQEVKNIVWVVGCYNWNVSMKKEERHKNKNYDRHNWCDIDVTDIKNHDAVLAVFKKHRVSCIMQRCGKGWHAFGDIVPFELWLKIWNEIRPYADPRWAPHTLRISKKRQEEIWERPVFYDYSNTGIKPWMKALMSFICKAMRGENSTNLKSAIRQVGIHKYFETPIYPVELK